MARRYEIEELLWLRNSPLITKPDKLPPIEEWMGPIPDPSLRKSNHRDQDSSASQRRPSLFGENRHVSKNSLSEDIVLGPPKTAFASASRIHGKGGHETSERLTRNVDDEGRADRFAFREKSLKDREGGDPEKRDNRFATPGGRRNDREDWNTGRPRRTFGQEEGEQRPRRNGETNKWDSRDKQDELAYSRNFRDKDGRYDKEGRPTKREVNRGRHEQSWFRDGAAGEDSTAADEEKPFMREREWRRDKQASDRDWNRGSRLEQDPEWMDSTDRDDPKQTHTQEDFQRWKERMKAGSSTPAQLEQKKEPVSEQASPEAPKTEANHLDGELFASNRGHVDVDAGFDEIFSKIRESKPPAQENAISAEAVDSLKRDLNAAKASKSSRFAGLFSPPSDPSTKRPDPAQAISYPERPSSTDADQEGFQRILQMLGGNKSRNSTPQADSSQQPRPPPFGMHEQGRPTPPPGFSSPTKVPHNRPDELLVSRDLAGSRPLQPPPGMESMLPPRDPQPHPQDRENLLRLMQQVNVSSPKPNQYPNALPPASSQPHLAQGSYHTPGILNVPDLLSRPQGMQKAPKNQTFFDDPAIANMQRPDSGAKGSQLQKPNANEPQQMRYFDELGYHGVPQGGPVSSAPGIRRESQLPPHMGIPRPPGFGPMLPGPPPGWAGQLPQQGTLGPPPGIPNTNKGMNPNFLGSPMPLPGDNIRPPPPGQPPNDSPPYIRGGPGGNFGLPPGMMPPPGYMNMNMNGPPPPPPSGFMPVPHNHEVLLNNLSGQRGAAYNNAVSGGPPPSSRHLLEMLAHANGGNGGGAGGDGRGPMLGGGLGGGQFR